MTERGAARDAIFAEATPATVADRLVVRASGARVLDTIARLARAPLPRSRCVVDTELELEGLWASRVVLPVRLLLFPGPKSYTGEDLVEIHTLSSPSIAGLLSDALVAAELRPAEAGEFTRRAFENGKMQLAQAEAICALIRAEDDEALRRASATLQSGADDERAALREAFVELIAELESGLDFTEDETGALDDADWLPRLDELLARLDAIPALAQDEQRAALPSYLLLGPPNAGKTSLWNALRDAALPGGDVQEGIVSEQAGSTRDVRWGLIADERGEAVLRVGDAPGRLELALGAPGEDPELELVRSELARADGYLWVCPRGEACTPPAALPAPALAILTKCDDDGDDDDARADEEAGAALRVSAQRGAGLEALRARLRALGARAGGSAGHASRRAITLASEAGRRARDARELGHELVVAELAEAVAALAPDDAHELPEELLDRIFARFCLGK